MKKLIYPELTKTTYSNLWIQQDKIDSSSGLQEPFTYRPIQFIVSYNNKYMGNSINMYDISPTLTTKEILSEMKYYCGKNVTNISIVTAKFHVDLHPDGTFHKRGERYDNSSTTLPLLSKKGGKLKQIDVNFMALLTVSDLYQLNDSLMHEIISEKMNPFAKTHADVCFTDEQCTTKTWADNDTGYEPYRSCFRPQLELELI